MKNVTTKQKIAVLGAVTYTTIIGVGMYLMQLSGATYGQPKMVNTLWVVEITLTAITVFFTVKYFSWKEVGFSKLQTKQLLWMVPSIILLVVMWAVVISLSAKNGLSNEQVNLISLVGFTTLLVGFSEELMYRGILLNSFLKTRSKTSAILISAVGFSLLHSVNILGGLGVGQMLVQLIFTFMFGLLFALLYLRIKNLIPLMIFHWLWDFALFAGTVASPEDETLGSLSSVHLIIQVVLIIVLFIYLKKGKGLHISE